MIGEKPKSKLKPTSKIKKNQEKVISSNTTALIENPKNATIEENDRKTEDSQDSGAENSVAQQDNTEKKTNLDKTTEPEFKKSDDAVEKNTDSFIGAP